MHNPLVQEWCYLLHINQTGIIFRYLVWLYHKHQSKSDRGVGYEVKEIKEPRSFFCLLFFFLFFFFIPEKKREKERRKERKESSHM
jgi:hypothetical protein